MKKIIILIPLKIELKLLVKFFLNQDRKFIEKSNQFGKKFEAQDDGIIIAEGGHGKVAFGISAQRLISEYENEVAGVLCVGAGGALDKSLRPLDVVLGRETVEHDYKEKFDSRACIPRFSADPRLLQMFQKSFPEFHVHTGIVASGDEDIVDPNRAEELHLATGASVVAWEGAGAARACLSNQIPFLEVRAITDNARDNVTESFEMNLPLAMLNAGRLIEAALF